MPHSLASILVHAVFSTKHRDPMLPDAVRDELHAYIGGIVSHHNGTLLRAGSVADHIHLLIAHPRTCAPAALVRAIKAGSSLWLKSQAPELAAFRWQSGYGLFSVSPSQRRRVERYLDRQALHHRAVTFQEEYRQILTLAAITFDERWVWD